MNIYYTIITAFIIIFRDSTRSKSKIFAYKDHGLPIESVETVLAAFRQVDPNQPNFTPKERVKAVRELLLQKIQKIASLPGLEDHEAVDRDRLPKAHHTFQSFINQSASIEASKTNDILVDWNIPIKLRLTLLPDRLT